VGDDRVSLGEAQQLHSLSVFNLVHPNFADVVRLVLHVDQVLSVEVEWDAVLSED